MPHQSLLDGVWGINLFFHQQQLHGVFVLDGRRQLRLIRLVLLGLILSLDGAVVILIGGSGY